jgi:putative oxidoreductase
VDTRRSGGFAEWFFATETSGAVAAALLILRLALGIVILAHGLQKFGLFGGPGLAGTIAFLGMAGIPPAIAILPIVTESLGSIFLIFGFLSRLVAFAIAFDMLVAALLVHVKNGFFMNWTGQQKGEGFEFHILAIGIGLAVLVAGAGRYSVDALFSRRR